VLSWKEKGSGGTGFTWKRWVMGHLGTGGIAREVPVFFLKKFLGNCARRLRGREDKKIIIRKKRYCLCVEGLEMIGSCA